MSPLENPAAFRAALRDWYRRQRRELPWRTAPSLYGTVVSEFMLQQTQVKTMLPYYERWMERFPDFETLATAPADEVLRYWEGLGYYSRARNLHKLAGAWIALERKPATAREWKALPGIGPYTAAAVSSIALGHPAAVVDGNVVRILARLTGDEREFRNGAEAIKAFTPAAEALLDHDTPGDHNQAMMELGATVCLKRKPLCTICPVVNYCAAASSGEPDAFPRIRRRATEHVVVDRIWIVRRGRILLHRIPDDAPQLAGQHELPRFEHLGGHPPTARLLATKTRSITHRRIKERIHEPERAIRITKHPELQWIAVDALGKVTLSGPHRRWIRELLESHA